MSVRFQTVMFPFGSPVRKLASVGSLMKLAPQVGELIRQGDTPKLKSLLEGHGIPHYNHKMALQELATGLSFREPVDAAQVTSMANSLQKEFCLSFVKDPKSDPVDKMIMMMIDAGVTSSETLTQGILSTFLSPAKGSILENWPQDFLYSSNF